MAVCFKWYARLHDARESIEGDPHPRALSTVRVEENIKKLAEILQNVNYVSTRLTEGLTVISKTTGHNILT